MFTNTTTLVHMNRGHATNDRVTPRTGSHDTRPPVRDPKERTFLNNVVSLAGGVSVVLLVPTVLLLVGVPIVLSVRGLIEGVRRLFLLMLG